MTPPWPLGLKNRPPSGAMSRRPSGEKDGRMPCTKRCTVSLPRPNHFWDSKYSSVAVVILGAGHDEPRDVRPVPAAGGQELLGEQRKQRELPQGRDGEHALGTFEPQAAIPARQPR